MTKKATEKTNTAMKKRDDVQPFHNTARVSVSSTRILTPPQQQMNASSVNSSTSQNQFQIVNVLARESGSSMTTQTQNIHYTYTSSPTISIATNVHKNNTNPQSASQQQQQQNQATTPNLPNRAKNANTGGIIASAPIATNPVSTNALTPPNISGQNFPRLKVEDALSYLDQVYFIRFFSLLPPLLTDYFYVGEVQVWKSTASLQRFFGHHEGVQIAKHRHTGSHSEGFKFIQRSS